MLPNHCCLPFSPSLPLADLHTAKSLENGRRKQRDSVMWVLCPEEWVLEEAENGLPSQLPWAVSGIEFLSNYEKCEIISHLDFPKLRTSQPTLGNLKTPIQHNNSIVTRMNLTPTILKFLFSFSFLIILLLTFPAPIKCDSFEEEHCFSITSDNGCLIIIVILLSM